MMHISVRSRYRLLFICTALLLVLFFLPYRRENSIESDIAESINSILRLSARICKNGPNDLQKPITSSKDESRFWSLPEKIPPAPLSQLDRGTKSSGSKHNEETHKYPSSSEPKPDDVSSGQDSSSSYKPLIQVYESDLQWGGGDKPLPEPPLKPPQKGKPPIPDPFPLLSKPLSPFYKNLLSERTRPPTPHPEIATPLFIGFTRNWPQLIQCVTSYIAAGWTASDIYVVENTGVMYSNRDNKLSLQNPFYLNHTQLSLLGVTNILITPTLLTFSQLQNFYAWTALDRNWTEYFWSHQDVVVFSFEESAEGGTPSAETVAKQGYNIYDRTSNTSLYHRAVSVQRALRQKPIHTNLDAKPPQKWANAFFNYDQLTLVNTESVIGVGGWDTHIPFYTSDCDMYIRQAWSGYTHYTTREAGHILDVASVLDDVGALLRLPGIHASFAGDPGVPLEEQGWWRAINSNPPSPSDSSSSSDSSSVIAGGSETHYKSSPTSNTAKQDQGFSSSSGPEFPPSRGQSFMREINKLTRLKTQTSRFGETYTNLLNTIRRMSSQKYAGGTNSHRNSWQKTQSGRNTQTEPFYRDADGFEQGILMAIDLGRAVFSEKWGHRGCDIARWGRQGRGTHDGDEAGEGQDDREGKFEEEEEEEDKEGGIDKSSLVDLAWRVERDWDVDAEGLGHEGGW